jgi:hypothetical protein
MGQQGHRVQERLMRADESLKGNSSVGFGKVAAMNVDLGALLGPLAAEVQRSLDGVIAKLGPVTSKPSAAGFLQLLIEHSAPSDLSIKRALADAQGRDLITLLRESKQYAHRFVMISHKLLFHVCIDGMTESLGGEDDLVSAPREVSLDELRKDIVCGDDDFSPLGKLSRARIATVEDYQKTIVTLDFKLAFLIGDLGLPELTDLFRAATGLREAIYEFASNEMPSGLAAWRRENRDSVMKAVNEEETANDGSDAEMGTRNSKPELNPIALALGIVGIGFVLWLIFGR